MQTSDSAFETVVSSFQIKLLASLAEFLGRSGARFSVHSEYKIPSVDGAINSQTGFAAAGMPFELAITIQTDPIWIDIYTNGADAYEPQDGTYDPKKWQVRYEAAAFPSLAALAQSFLREIDNRFETCRRP
ncbi:MAG: hypothetical protein ACU0GG_16060 [Paracoccaceae bacterium]